MLAGRRLSDLSVLLFGERVTWVRVVPGVLFPWVKQCLLIRARNLDRLPVCC